MKSRLVLVGLVCVIANSVIAGTLPDWLGTDIRCGDYCRTDGQWTPSELEFGIIHPNQSREPYTCEYKFDVSGGKKGDHSFYVVKLFPKGSRHWSGPYEDLADSHADGCQTHGNNIVCSTRRFKVEIEGNQKPFYTTSRMDSSVRLAKFKGKFTIKGFLYDTTEVGTCVSVVEND